jgi:hypothetical protein
MADTESGPLLLQLPDTCLLAVLQCLAEDAASLCNAARVHSRLHQAAVVALSSISIANKSRLMTACFHTSPSMASMWAVLS